RVVALDLSAGMLRHAADAAERTGLAPTLLQAGAEHLPLRTDSFDVACSAFGALPFVPSLETVFAEVVRVLRPGGGWVFSSIQPMADDVPHPQRTGPYDVACDAIDALPFYPSLETVFAEVVRVLRPGGRWVFSVTHPMRWIFPDDPGPTGLTATQPYFDRT